MLESPYCQMARDKVKETYVNAKFIWNRDFILPRITFDLTGRRAGVAIYTKHLIKFNMVLLRENRETFLEDTCPHEAAHLISFALYGREGAGHKKRWKDTMVKLGYKPIRCHNFDTSNSARNGKVMISIGARLGGWTTY